MFTCEIPIRFNDVDHARIVYYPHFFHFCHIAMEEFFARDVGVAYHDLIDRDGIGLPTVHLEGDFAAPVTFGQTLRMGVELLRMGNTSMTLQFTATRTGDEVVVFRGSVTMVAVNMSDFKPMRMPDHYRAAIEKLRPAS